MRRASTSAHHSVQHTNRNEDCVVCLANLGSPALVRDRVPLDAPSCVRQHSAAEQPSLLHAGHGTPFSGRDPPPSRA
jgi:hypothetical protein